MPDSQHPSRLLSTILFLAGMLATTGVWIGLLIAAVEENGDLGKGETFYFALPILGAILAGGVLGYAAVISFWRRLPAALGRVLYGVPLAVGVAFPLLSVRLSAWAPGYLSLHSTSFTFSVAFYLTLLTLESAMLSTSALGATLALRKLKGER
jgi:hypothetical protein